MTLRDDIAAARKRREGGDKKDEPQQQAAPFDLEDLKAAQRRRLGATPEGREQLAEVNRPRQFQSFPEAKTGFGPVGSGFERGLTDVGLGALQIGTGAAERAGVDVGQLPERTREAVTTSRERFEAETAGAPVRGFAGQVAGFGAALPLAATTAPGAAAVGALSGALLPTEGENGGVQRAINTFGGAVGGAVFNKALPVIFKGIAAGGRKSVAFIRGITRAVGGSRGDDFVTTSGTLTKAGREALEAAGVNVDDMLSAAKQADDMTADDLQDALLGAIRGAGEEQLDPVSAARLARAGAQDIPLTSGQAQQDFTLQASEDLARNLQTAEGDIARQAADVAQAKIKGAVNKFVGQFGDEFQAVPPEQQGAAIKAGIALTKKASQKNASDLYKTAERELGSSVPLDIGDFADDVIDDIISRSASPEVERSVMTTMAKYGVIGEAVETKGARTIVNFNGQKIPVRGAVEPLTLSNAESFRKGLNKAFSADQTGVISAAVRSVDDAVEATLARAAGEGGKRVAAFEGARAAFSQTKKIFSAKDIVDDLVAFKRGTNTPKFDESVVVSKIFRARNALENIKRVKGALLATAPDEKTAAAGRTAWREFQQAGIDDIFKQAISPDGSISGARLNTAVKKMGNSSLRELMGKDRFFTFKQLQAAIGDATIPLKGTINPSGSGNRVVNLVLKLMEKSPLPTGKIGAGVIRRQLDKTTHEIATKQALGQIQQGRAAKLIGGPTAEQLASERLIAEFVGRYTAVPATRAAVLKTRDLTQQTTGEQ